MEKGTKEDKHFVPQNAYPILDSSLIVATKLDLYDIKLVELGDYIQVYLYDSKRSKNSNEYNNELMLKKQNKHFEIDTKIEDSIETDKPNIKSLNTIENKNIIRSKLECQRLAKANIKDWETFITLTFADNVKDINFANKRFHIFITKIQRVKKDFKYLCITEFQKRGATHYHLLCNISINDKKLIFSQEDNPKYKHIKYWLDGFTSVEEIKGDTKKIIGYIAKYMTKDIDNRLFNRHRYFYSRNLVKPKVNYINLEHETDKNYYIKKIQDSTLIYENEYVNPYDNSKVAFLEFTKGQ